MDIGVGEMAFIFCGKHPPLVTRIQVSDPGPRALLFKKIKLLQEIESSSCFLKQGSWIFEEQ